VNARALYLELSALGINPSTGGVPALDMPCREIAALMRRVRESRHELREGIGATDHASRCVRAEGRYGSDRKLPVRYIERRKLEGGTGY